MDSTTVRTFNATLAFTGTGSNTITTNGVTMASAVTVSGTGTWTFQDTYTSGSNTLTHTNGTLDTNGQTLTFGTFQTTGSTARTLNLGASVLNVTGFTYSGSNLTLNEGTSSIRNATSGTFAGNGETFYDVQYNSVTALVVTGANTYTTFSVTGTVSKTCFISFGANQTFTTSLTITGFSTTSRIYVRSDVKGTARTLTAASVTSSHADFQDITGAGAFGWNLSAITGNSGDCGGNSGITFTTSATQFYFKDTGTWSTAALWFLATNGGGGAGRVPLPQDDVTFDANSFSAGSKTVTCDMPRSGRTVTTSAVTNNPAFNFGNVAKSWFGSVTYGTHTIATGVALITLEGRGSQTFTSAGITQISPYAVDAPGGSYTMQDALTLGATLDFNLLSGTWSTGSNFAMTMGTLTSSNSSTRTLNINNSTITVSGTGNAINMSTATGLTLSKGGSSVVQATNVSATSKSLIFTSALDTLTISGDNVTKQQSCTVANLNINTAGLTNGFKVTSATTTITVTGTIATNGSAGNLAKLVSTIGASAGIISKSSGIVSVDYMSIQDSTATGGATFYAGANSTNVSGNTGWIFTAPPSGTLVGRMFLVF